VFNTNPSYATLLGGKRSVKVATEKGLELELPQSYITMKEDAEKTITMLVADHPKAKRM